MDDRLSLLPDPILCHILSFLPTKQSVATSVLSKRWMPLWRSVPTLDLEYSNYTGSKEEYGRFVHSVYAFIVSRDMHHPIHKFRLCCSSHSYDPTNVSVWANAVVQCKVQHLELSLCTLNPLQPPPNLSSIFTCKTLVVLKLLCNCKSWKPISYVHLPLLKVLHLRGLSFPKRGCLAELLSECPLLEVFKASDLYFNEDVTGTEFKTLPKLLRAELFGKTDVFLLGVVSNVKFLHINRIQRRLGNDTGPYNFPMFHNLTHLELVYTYYKIDWSEVVEFLKCCPKLQVLIINQPSLRFSESQLLEVPENWQYPPSVPKCILLHLKTCCLNDYRGTKGDFQFAKYIMRNGRFLKRLTISSSLGIKQRGKLELLKKLSSCKRRSATCKLSFN